MFSPARVWREFPQRYRLEAAKNIEGLQETLKAMSEFGSFVDRMNNQPQEEEETDGLQTQEG